MYFPAAGVKGAPCAFDTGGPSPKPKDSSLVAGTQKEPSLTGQLGDALVDVLKTFTGK